jgi:hypothetical protein
VTESWRLPCSKVYLEPLGVDVGSLFSWSADEVADIKKRNPMLENTFFFLLPRDDNRPFPVIGTTLVGPTAGSPYSPKSLGPRTASNTNYSLLEITPLYVGSAKTLDIEYHYSRGLRKIFRVGGGIETYAFGTQYDEKVYYRFLLGLPRGADWGGLPFDYWSPASFKAETENFLFADGGDYENINLISMVQRKVERSIVFSNGQVPLQPSENWDFQQGRSPGREITR